MNKDKIIKDLKENNRKLKNQYELQEIRLCSSQYKVDELEEENNRLNNIINEFDKWLLGEKMLFYRGSDDERLIRYYETKNKWLELKEGK